DMESIDKLPTTFARLICLDEEWEKINALSSSNLLSLTHPHHLAYAIYTSGSTGKPKGVLIDQGNLLHYINNSKATYPLSHEGATLLHSSIAFDMSITSLFLPLVIGNTLHIASAQIQGDSLEEINNKLSQLSAIKLTPTQLGALKETLSTHVMDNRERCFIIGGENLLKEDLSPWLNNQAFAYATLLNEYGPTEATVGCCVFEISDLESSLQASVPIGRPISNTQIYILDSNLNPVPIGVTGEIYVGGAGLARGYLNKPDLTADKFVPNPFANEENVKEGKSLRLYRTGDLARFLPDGNIEFLGRIDDQVKIRGFRVELGEIESALSQYGDVKQAVVTVREDQPSDKKLIAYVILQESLTSSLVKGPTLLSSSQQEFTILSGDILPALTEALRNHLARSLPDYMIPSFFVFLNKIPFTANAKVDRKSLPAPDFNGDADSYVAPRNETESELCSIWEEVLGLPSGSVGIHGDFFKLGGNSLLAIRLVSKINTAFSRHVSLQDIIKRNSVSEISSLFQETVEILEYGEI
ncbi:MAG: non-ribosomal peptide synthetase, partial [Caedimonadaceae bacterium]